MVPFQKLDALAWNAKIPPLTQLLEPAALGNRTGGDVPLARVSTFVSGTQKPVAQFLFSQLPSDLLVVLGDPRLMGLRLALAGLHRGWVQ